MKPLAWYGNWQSYPDPDPTPEPPPSKDPVAEPEAAPAVPKRGLVLGRFLPPHRGHQYLVNFARSYVEQLTVVVNAGKDDPIPVSQRIEWLEEMFGGQPLFRYGEPSVTGWAEWIRHQVGPVDYLFGSDVQGGPAFAQTLGAEYVAVDPERQAVPISGSEILRRPFTHWKYLPECVRPWYVRRVVLAGPEGSGKTTLVKRLGERFHTVYVREQAADLAASRGGRLSAADLLRAARAQWSAEQSLARQADRVLFLDTDALMARLWSERLYQKCSPELDELSRRGKYDLYLVLDPRDLNPNADAFHRRILEALEARKLPYCKLYGNQEQLFSRACEAMKTLLLEPALPTPPAGSAEPA